MGFVKDIVPMALGGVAGLAARKAFSDKKTPDQLREKASLLDEKARKAAGLPVESGSLVGDAARRKMLI